ncbi:MAG: MAPEG family protein [Ectothiorhodospiraceae bacterium]|nr:MAPEG family protein [Ectothiorhodospiraceae bacterium]
MSTSAVVFGGFIAWTLFLLVLMELLRSYLVVTGQQASNAFRPDNANLSPFMQRLARAHANCVESLPVFGGLLVLALVTGQSHVTDPLAPWFLAARVIQSGIHLSSLSVPAVNARFAAFAVQIVIGVYWAWSLLAGTGG